MVSVNSMVGSVVTPVVSGVIGASGGAPTWSFASLADLEYWYDASDIASITAAGGVDVTQWNDKSGNARHLVNSAGDTTRPTTGATLLNGLNVIDVTANHLQTMALVAESPILPQPFHMFVVVRATLTPDATRFCCGMSVANRAMIWGNTNWTIFAGAAGASSIACDSTGTFFISALFNGAASKIWINGAAPQTVNAFTQSIGGFRLNGGEDGAGFHLTGSFAEIALCSGDKSADIDTVKTNMAAKWGLSL